MKKIYMLMVVAVSALMSACSTFETQKVEIPACQSQATAVVYDGAEPYEVPACMDYAVQPQVTAFAYDQTVMFVPSIDITEVDPEQIEGEFPEVPGNKYLQNEVVLQNLQTRVLAYCRGSEEDIEKCIEKMECNGYRRLTEVPYMSAKYDKLKQGTYPARRWRNGENVSRW